VESPKRRDRRTKAATGFAHSPDARVGRTKPHGKRGDGAHGLKLLAAIEHAASRPFAIGAAVKVVSGIDVEQERWAGGSMSEEQKAEKQEGIQRRSRVKHVSGLADTIS
jgi:hypothetical protein